MTNHERAKEIRTCRAQMKKLTHEFMLATDIQTADAKLNELTELGAKVVILKQEQKDNGFIAKFKKKLGLR